MSAFSKNYQSVIDWSDVGKSAARSKVVSASRSKRMKSDDVQVRINAMGIVPGMKGSKIKESLLKTKI
jgi:hypothetical protein